MKRVRFTCSPASMKTIRAILLQSKFSMESGSLGSVIYTNHDLDEAYMSIYHPRKGNYTFQKAFTSNHMLATDVTKFLQYADLKLA